MGMLRMDKSGRIKICRSLRVALHYVKLHCNELQGAIFIINVHCPFDVKIVCFLLRCFVLYCCNVLHVQGGDGGARIRQK